MATQNKTTSKSKTSTKAADKPTEKAEVVNQEEKVVKETKPQRKIRKNIDLNEMVLCRSVVIGGLTYISPKTQTQIRWNNYGDEEYVPFGELITMNASKRRFLHEPWLVIEDDEVVTHFGLNKVYAKLIDTNNIEGFFAQSLDEIREKLKVVPSSMRELISTKAREMIEDETLTDIRIIKLLEQELKVDLQILID